MSRHVVAAVGELPPGAQKLVHVKGRRIALFNVGGAYFALSDLCPHQGGSLSEGLRVGLVSSEGPGSYTLARQGEFIRCPWHGWEFDLRTGQSWCDPGRFRVRPYPVEVESGTALAKGPYVAETFPVSADGQYLVVEL